MGTWGHGNFDDDTSAQHLWALTDRLVKEVSTAMADPEKITPEEYWGCAIPSNIEVLNVVARQKWHGTALPSVAVAEQWKRDYLAVWDEWMDRLEARPEYKTKRREVLMRTFDELARHALWREKEPHPVFALLTSPSGNFERDGFAQVFVEKVAKLSGDGAHEEVIAICDQAVTRLEDASGPAVLEMLALALSWKAYSLAALRRFDEAAAMYDAVATRFGAVEDASVQDIVERSRGLQDALKQSRLDAEGRTPLHER